MNQLIKSETSNSLIVSTVDKKAMEALLPVEKRIIEAALQPKINIQDPLDVQESLLSYITACYTRAGYKMPDETTLAAYALDFYEILIENFPLVTLPEIREALKAGVYGAAGEFTGLNPKTFNQFVKHYLRTDERKDAVRQFEARRNYINEQAKHTPAQKEEFNREYVNEQYQLYLEGNLLLEFTPVDLYEFLYNGGHMPLTKEEKKAINERACSHYTRVKHSKRLKGNEKSLSDALSDYYNSGPAEQIIKNYSKRLAVLDFFGNLKLQGKTEVFSQTKLLE